MSQIVFLPGFDGNAELRRDFTAALAKRHEVRAVSYPNRTLGSLDAYRVQAMGEAPVDWRPVLVAESFSGLVATRWASLDARVEALVLCGSFARNPLGYATELGAAWPALVKMGPALVNPAAQLSAEPARRRWSGGKLCRRRWLRVVAGRKGTGSLLEGGGTVILEVIHGV